jgi:hypothetical protein
VRFLETLGRNVLWGLRNGALFGLIFSAWAVVELFVGGPETFSRQGTSFVEVIGLYLVGGSFAGAIVGMLRPFAYHRLGAAVVGFFSALPLAIGTKLMLSGFKWALVDGIYLFFFPLLLGCGAGLVLHNVFLEKST